MSVLFMDSFDHYEEEHMPKKWTQTSNLNADGIQIGATYGRNSGNGMRLSGGADGIAYCRKVLSAAATTLIVGIGFKPNAISSTLIAFDDQTVPGEQVSLRYDANQNKVLVSRNGTTLATGTTVLNNGVFYHIEFKATINNTTGAYTVRIQEVQELTASGVNTRGSGTNNSADAVRIGSPAGVAQFATVGYFDDLYVCDDAGGVNNDFLGDCRVQALFPNGAGATTAWTPLSGANYTNVDDVNPDDDTTYVSTGTVGAIDTYSMSDLAATTGSVKAIQTVLDARKDDSGTRTIAPVFHIGASDYVGTNQNIMTSYSMFLQVYQVSPATAVAWTVAEVNALNYGQKLIA